MGNRKIIKCYYEDISNLTDLLSKMVNSYRLLIGGAGEINQITLARKGEVRDALRRADKLGESIDEIIKTLEYMQSQYVDYCKLKASILEDGIQKEYVETEIDEELKLKE